CAEGITKCFAARQTIEDSSRTHTAAVFRRGDRYTNSQDMIIDYRCESRKRRCFAHQTKQVECFLPHVFDLQCTARRRVARNPALLADAEIAPWEVSRWFERALGKNSSAPDSSPPSANNMGSRSIGRRSARGERFSGKIEEALS